MRKPNPLQDANFCSRLFFCWLNPLFKIGYKRRLEEDDMYSVLPEDRSQHLGEELQGYWDQEVLRAEKDAREPSLMKAILKCHWKSYLVLGIFILLEEGTRVVQPIFLGKMINYVENSNRTDSAALHEAYGYAAGLSTSVRVWAILHHLYFYRIQRVGMRLRVAVCHMIYRKESETPTLQGLSFTVRPGELLAVVGPVGAGKSSLLRALLGELPPSQGQVNVHGRIVYVSQQPWVFSGTVRSNILFGKKYEEERYEKDLQLLKENDITEIGDWGTPLSEGQKAQVSLARAVYQDSDVYLLDDPLSAVDAGVSRHLFEQCIRQALKEKITILVTHQLQYLKDASQILIMKDVAYFLQDWWLAYWANGQSTLYVLVSGNGRMNEIPDPDWYLTLTQVQLKEAIRDLPGKMDTELAEYGSNFSVGQQQLVCLTRAILRTDELIKKEIREKFAQCTVLTIAHRLSTIIDSEWIMVLDSGRMKEYGRPYDLLQNTNSLFYKMVQQLGEAEAAALTERAEQIHFKKQKIARYHSDLVVMNASSG